MTSNPVLEAAGAPAAVVAHVPTWPGRLHCSSGASQAVSQQTPSAHSSVEHCEGVLQAPPCGTGLAVGVLVAVPVLVAVLVAVAVAVAVAVSVAVGVLVSVGSITEQPADIPWPQVPVGSVNLPHNTPSHSPLQSFVPFAP